MVSTEKLYYLDSYLAEFEAEVLECALDGENYKAVLDRTAFFPEGGGQYADTGYLNEVRVLDVQEEKREGSEVIVHMTKEPLKVGSTVVGKLDWQQRFDRMQQHSGEHIVSGYVNKTFGYENVGFHLGDDYCTMDFNGILTKEDLTQIEEIVNQAIYENGEIRVLYPSKEELKDFNYRSKIEIEGQVRLIDIVGYDLCACCAPHVRRTGEIGMIKFTGLMKHRGGVRVTMKAGKRALCDYQMKDANSKLISNLLSLKEEDIFEGVKRKTEEIFELTGKINALKEQLLQMKAGLAFAEAESKTIIYFDEKLEKTEPRLLMNILLDEGAEICAIFAGNDVDGYSFVIGSRMMDVRTFSNLLREEFSARGGGKPEMVQGSVKAKKEDIKTVLSKAIED